jgi:hypothetical protein
MFLFEAIAFSEREKDKYFNNMAKFGPRHIAITFFCHNLCNIIASLKQCKQLFEYIFSYLEKSGGKS